MKDFNGNELTVGDKVAYIRQTRTSAWLKQGVVTGFTDCFVKLSDRNGSPSKVVKVN